ncbi:MAG: hypothetical protein AB1641_21695 [Thermodesulfobacteriota bacterium]
MADFDQLWNRLGVILELIEKSPSKTLGRTAVMKLLYLLQTVKGLPLGYDFRLYVYGPFDSGVLEDLEYAETLEAVATEVRYFPSGYSYHLRSGKKADEIRNKSFSFLQRYKSDIDSIMDEFGSKSASDLELISTIIFSDGNYAQRNTRVTIKESSARIREIKPQFTLEKIESTASALLEKGLLKALA